MHTTSSRFEDTKAQKQDSGKTYSIEVDNIRVRLHCDRPADPHLFLWVHPGVSFGTILYRVFIDHFDGNEPGILPSTHLTLIKRVSAKRTWHQK
jgi:hypothetical protein